MAESNVQEQRPGHFHLPLKSVKEREVPVRDLKRRLKSLEQQLTWARHTSVSSYHQLIGVILAALSRHEEALEHFRIVLDADCSNLNALANCVTMCEKMGRDEEAQQYQQRLQQQQQQQASNQRDKATMFLEQAFALTYEPYHREDQNRYLTAISLYESGVELLPAEPVEDRVEWLLNQCVAYHKLLRLKRGQCHVWYTKVVKIIHQAQQESAALPIEYGCWNYLGLFLSKPHLAKADVSEFMLEQGLQEYFENPALCFERSLELRPLDKDTVCRYADFLIRKKRALEARNLLNELIESGSPDVNWYVRDLLAKANNQLQDQ